MGKDISEQASHNSLNIREMQVITGMWITRKMYRGEDFTRRFPGSFNNDNLANNDLQSSV